MGFTLKEIDELPSLKAKTNFQCSDIRKKAERKIKQVNDKIHDLIKIKNALKEPASVCRRNESTGECPILEAFYPDEG